MSDHKGLSSPVVNFQLIKGDDMFEVCIVWDGEFFAHEALTIEEAQEWADQYKAGPDCTVRIWRLF